MSLKSNLEKLVEMKSEVAPLIKAIRDLEKETKLALMEMSADEISKISVSGLDITPRDGYVKTTWDSKSLEELGAIIPEVLECKKVSEVKPTIAYKFL